MKSAAVLIIALFTMVSLAGLSNADHGEPVPPPEHPAGACSPPFHVQWAEWDFCWQQDDVRGQGLELNQVYFHGESVLAKVGFPFSITRYESDVYGPYKDTLGSSAGGSGDNPGFGRGSMAIHPAQCPRFFGAGVLLNDQHICVEQRAGPEPAVAIWARYDIFNYRFIQGYILDQRGSIEPFIRLGGLLIDGAPIGSSGTNHFHNLYWRADFDIGLASEDKSQMFLRPDPAWNDWDPYVIWTPSDDTSTTHPDCSRFPPDQTPPPCRGWENDGDFTLVDPLAGFPSDCRQQVADGRTGWCDIDTEGALNHHPALFTKWRVADPFDTNFWDHAKSFESTGHTHHDTPSDGAFTTFDTMILEHHGASQEIGFEVPPLPIEGDTYLHTYQDPPEAIEDPVVWFSARAYHDTRDEEHTTMTYHHVSFIIEPRNFLSHNQGEDTYTGAPNAPRLPGGVGPGPCVGPVCIA